MIHGGMCKNEQKVWEKNIKLESIMWWNEQEMTLRDKVMEPLV